MKFFISSSCYILLIGRVHFLIIPARSYDFVWHPHTCGYTDVDVCTHGVSCKRNPPPSTSLHSPALGNTRGATLFGCLDRTVTAGGGRLLQDRLSAPLTDLQQINQSVVIKQYPSNLCSITCLYQHVHSIVCCMYLLLAGLPAGCLSLRLIYCCLLLLYDVCLQTSTPPV